jgi:hypothetical protein
MAPPEEVLGQKEYSVLFTRQSQAATFPGASGGGGTPPDPLK